MGTKRTARPGGPRTGPARAPYVLTVVVLLLAILAAASVGTFSARPVIDGTVEPVESVSTPTPSAEGTPAPLIDDGDRIVIDPDLTMAVLLLLAVSLLALVVRYLLRLRSRPTIRGGSLDEAQVRPPSALDPVAEALPTWTRTAEQLLIQDADASDAVIRCWLDFERLCARAGLPRRPTQTTSDFASAAATALDLPVEPLTTLNRLYQRARFARSHHDGRDALGAADREIALRSIRLLAAAVPSDRPVRR
ncbi:DUF4129 domain-containing protein [Arthrobacter echini]|uniref:DUF4129 domain-containing protein n=1 Tax=Arthrobacter echini TaxID=1529066 RepID=A0A4S5E413_9MICC|nr:DUF4129 domain-containing protein [Arthrobacter echini]THJ66177.1 DUF4129 domain-containing protein [Arthrobacter echini]